MKSHHARRGLALAAAMAIVVWGMGLSISAAQAAIVGYVPDHILVKFHANTSPAAARNAHARVHARVADTIPGIDVQVVQLPPSTTVPQALAAYNNDPNVEFAEADGIGEPDLVPNDPSYSLQWFLPKIHGPTAWDTTTGVPGIIVAILDTGIDPKHHGSWPQTWCRAGMSTTGTSDTHDVYGHGTSVAGVVAAIGNNGVGVASVAWGCRIMPIRISDTSGYGYFSTVASGLTWAADHGARVANISYEFSDSSTVLTAAAYFQSNGGVVTMSAGNDNTLLTIPDSPYVLTVGATDSNDARASFSNRGPVLDLVAPGVNITTTANGGGYRTSSGTSFSAPIVAGVAALVLSVNANLTPTQVQDIVTESADDLGAPATTRLSAGAGSMPRTRWRKPWRRCRTPSPRR